MTTARPELDPLLVDPTRLSIVSLLAACEWAEFSYVRDSAAISDSAMSKQAAMLEKNGYLAVKKGYVGKRPRTWLQLSEAGRSKLHNHILALERIVREARSAGVAHDSQP